MLVSDETYQRVVGHGEWKFRRVCHIRPAGFQESYPIYELVLPKSVGGSGIRPEDSQTYEKALQFMIDRQWKEAIELLTTLPSDDPPTGWLLEKANLFQKNPPSESWGGEIASLSK